VQALLERDVDGNVAVQPARHDVGAFIGEEMRQTFRIESGYSEVVFAAPSARSVETDRLLRGRPDGTVWVAGGMDQAFGKDSVYTVTSRSVRSTADDLARAPDTVPQAILDQYAQPPEATNRVRALAAEVTAPYESTFEKIRALEVWMEDNLEYSLDAPLAPAGVDVVDDFLFRSRLGWCEQIASSLVVLARSAGIPARLATGFVPGERDALTGRFVVRERDAHAWAEIYFADIGWQGFDPTASVPFSGEARSDGSWLQTLRRHALPLGLIAIFVVLLITALPNLVAVLRNRRARRASWTARTFDRLERIGRKAGRPRAPAETPREYASVLAERLQAPQLNDVGAILDEASYSGRDAPAASRDTADAVLSSLRP
jgi:transglutaminase-like putative cysteine protease